MPDDGMLDTSPPEFIVPPEATQAVSIVGGSHVAQTISDLQDRNAAMWKLFNPNLFNPDLLKDPGSKPPEHHAIAPPPPPPLPDQLGPFAWGPIAFGGGVPVGGWAQVTLFRDGSYLFTGHFHDSGFTSYDMSCAYAIRSESGTVYTFSHRGRVHGTFESGSRDDNWGAGGTNPAIAGGWSSLAASLSWSANAGANVDLRALLDGMIEAVGTAATVIAIVA